MLPSARSVAGEVLSVLQIVAAVFLSWKLLCIVTDSRTPIIVVTSESMEPAFQKGDLLFVWNRVTSLEVGDVAVVWFPDRQLPMVSIARAISSTATNHSSPRFIGLFRKSQQITPSRL